LCAIWANGVLGPSLAPQISALLPSTDRDSSSTLITKSRLTLARLHPCVDFEVSDYVEDAVSAYQESRRAASDTFLPRYIRDDSARAHVKHKRERYAENRNNQHGLLKASGAESFRDRG
jgi:hypothetical protein